MDKFIDIVTNIAFISCLVVVVIWLLKILVCKIISKLIGKG